MKKPPDRLAKGPSLDRSSMICLQLRIANHFAGAGCKCYARSEGECACAGVNWRTRSALADDLALSYLIAKLSRRAASDPFIQEAMDEAKAIRGAAEHGFKPPLVE